ncbi:hypothetical protein GCM10009679_11040 [Saccharothrix algeriensis]|uniref:Ig-like domain-containing protein n=1 Tax=Catellatospora bangladeshensis TaxID=310355 RepID=A0A8J3JIQ8_9ACTN|nr:hypothetical protein Cba03nite_25210 [Catellatospora bangladeshensis]
MAPLRKRMLAVAAFASLATLVAAGPAAAAPAGADRNKISLTSLGFAADHVDATGNDPVSYPAVDVKWTITDGDTAATKIRGSIKLQLFHGDKAVGPAKAYTWALEPDGVADVFADDWWQARPQESSYTLTFVVPQYGPAEQVTWRVTSLSASDDRGNTREFSDKVLSQHDASVAVTELVDTANPDLQSFTRGWGQLSELFDHGGPLTLKYNFYVAEQAGFWKGRLKLDGPGRAKASASFELTKANSYTWMCGEGQNYDNQMVWCEVAVTLPAGAPAGVWRVAGVELTDTVGHRGTYTVDSTTDVRVTRNEQLSASGFALSATEVDSWRESKTVRLSLRPAGAQGAVTAVRLTSRCWSADTTPQVEADGTVSVELVMPTIFDKCSIDGIAIDDAAGNLALYGSHYGGPDLGLTVRRVADTTAPVVLSAVLSRTTAPSSELYAISATVTVERSVAPIHQYSFTFYDSRGWSSGGGSGGIHENPDGTVTITAWLYNPPPGVYTGGFTLTDAAGNYAQYGYPNGAGNPVPNGPLVLTVTEG